MSDSMVARRGAWRRNTAPRGADHLSSQQRDALAAILRWLRSDTPVFHLDGHAGTGKTTLVVGLPEALPSDRIQYVTPTGKAASVLRQRGVVGALTLHALLYGSPTIRQGRDGEELVWRLRTGKSDAALIVADESSMIDEKLGRDLLATGIKVLITGDSAQLPPVSGRAFFAGRPDFTLTEIHRQAADSQPLKLATAIRQGQRVRPRPFNMDVLLEADVVICALNQTRRDINRTVRRALGHPRYDAVAGDRIVGLRNNRDSGIWNGELWTIEGIAKDDQRDVWRLHLVDDGGTIALVRAHEDGFFLKRPDLHAPDYERLDLFDFGYALTCHKAQGSEWNRVVVIDETSSPGFEWITDRSSITDYRRRWLYTAVTRAKQQVDLMEAPE